MSGASTFRRSLSHIWLNYVKIVCLLFSLYFRVTLPSVVHLLNHVLPNGEKQSKNHLSSYITRVCLAVLFVSQTVWKVLKVLCCRLLMKIKSHVANKQPERIIHFIDAFYYQCKFCSSLSCFREIKQNKKTFDISPLFNICQSGWLQAVDLSLQLPHGQCGPLAGTCSCCISEFAAG